MLEYSALSLLREYVVLVVLYSLIAAFTIELLLRFWQVDSSATRVKLRLVTMALPPLLAVFCTLLRAPIVTPNLLPSFSLIDAQRYADMINRHFPWIWYPLLAVLMTSAVHFVGQLVVPVLRRGRWSICGNWEQQPRLASAYASVARAAGFSPRLIFVGQNEPLAEVRGTRSPAVWVSTGLIDLLDDAELETVLGHEFAHISRGDLVMNWLLAFLRALMFFNPVAAIVHTLIALDAERVCDDWAMTWIPRPAAFASALIKIHRASCGRRSRLSPPVGTWVAARVAHWESRALHSFTVERICRLRPDCETGADHLASVRLAIAVAAVAAILLFVV